MSVDPYRLPKNVRPVRYTIEIRPDLRTATSSGNVGIELEIVDPTDRIVLNSLDLELSDVSVNDAPVVSVECDPATERVSLVLADELAPGPALVRITFKGVLNDKLMGFYRSTFKLSDPATGQESDHTIAVTQFESTHARAAFPCFDEPEMKATFRISLVISDDLFAVSNAAEVARTDLGDGTVRIDFAETMKMSTYLVAFVVGPLVATEPRLVEGADGPIPLRVIHTPGSEHLCDFALDVAEAALQFFERYYGIPYPGDKVDLVAVPDFAFGAMENLGCVTFREVLLLIDPESATQPELQRVADVINHELAHMWFGDLVTMKWWNGIWLNEAFATFMEVSASDAFRHEWDVWTSFGLDRAAAFDTDALSSTRPIEYEVISPADSEGMFDVLTYEKGASVVRMLEQYLGAETFRRGIARYLEDHSYGNTETTDLWDSLEAASGEPVRRIMDSWIFRGGHPKVSVVPTETGVRLSQERFSYAESPDGRDDSRWSIPLTLRYRLGDASGTSTEDDSATLNVLLESDTEIDLGGRPSLVQVNAGGNGFFRSELDSALRAALAGDRSATALERFVLIDDTCAALNAGRVDLDEVWELLLTIAEHESEPPVWRRIGAAARELYRLGGPARHERDAASVIDLTNPGLQRVKAVLMGAPDPTRDGPGSPGGESDDSEVPLTKAQEVRGVIAALRGTIGADAHVREHTRQIFDMTRIPDLSNGMVDPSLRAAAIEVVGYTATPAQHEELRRRWRNASTPQEELRYLTALVDTDDPGLFTLTLELALAEVRSQNAPYLLARAIAHRSLAGPCWDFVSANWSRIVERFPSNSLPRMLAGIRGTTDHALAQRMEDDIAGFDVPSGRQQVDQHIERMWVSVRAAERVRG